MPSVVEDLLAQIRNQQTTVSNDTTFNTGAQDASNPGNQTSVRDIEAVAAERAFGENNTGDQLTSLLEQIFGPEFARLQGDLPGLEQAFMSFLTGEVDLSQVTAGINQSVSGLLGELSRPGGELDTATFAGLTNEINRGTGPRSGGFENARLNILDRLQGQVGNLIAQQAPALFSTAVQNRGNTLQGLGGFLGLQAGRTDALRDSLFTGRQSIEQLRLGQESQLINTKFGRQGIADARKANEGGGFLGFVGDVVGTGAGFFAGKAGSKLADRLIPG